MKKRTKTETYKTHEVPTYLYMFKSLILFKYNIIKYTSIILWVRSLNSRVPY